MSVKKFVRVLITATTNEEYLLEELFPGAELETEDEVALWCDENAPELLLDDEWAAWDMDVRIFEREVEEN